jgi:hypothetical protein
MHPHHPVQSHRSEKRVQMNFSVRAAGFAVAACVFAVSAVWSDPLKAVEARHLLYDHDGAATEVADFSLNADQVETAAPAASVGPAIQDTSVRASA